MLCQAQNLNIWPLRGLCVNIHLVRVGNESATKRGVAQHLSLHRQCVQ